MMKDFFIKNLAIFTEEEMESLKEKRVLVAGCGGLGGSCIELLARSGIGHLIVADMDCFEPSNMNRQILCTTDTLGQSKADAAAERAQLINPDIDVTAVKDCLNEENAAGIIGGCDIVIDALDSAGARLMLEEACAGEEVFLIHGAVNGWALQIGVCPPKAGMLRKLYGDDTKGKGSGGIAMTVFACAAFEVSEAIKILLERPCDLSGKFLFFDLLDKESQVISLD